MSPGLAEIDTALRARRLALRGAFHPVPADAVPPLAGGRGVATLVLAGQVGRSLWERFAAERRDEADPLDAWSARALGAIAASLGAELRLPGDGPPHPPFQRWAERAEPVHRSPLGLLIHPEYGLWHAYRGALAFAERLALPPREERPSPCAGCPGRPCLTACPVSAFRDGAYDDAACAAHVTSSSGAECRTRGCLARRACPIGREHAYAAEQQRFHMEAFLALRGQSA